MKNANRRQSVPSGSAPSSQQATPDSTSTDTSHNDSQPVKARPDKLLAQAGALAKMTYDLNLRTVNSQAERLERDVRELVRCTENDKDFRRENEERLSMMTKEILSVKDHMQKMTESNKGLTADYHMQQQLTSDLVNGFRQEMEELKGFFDALSNQMDQLPTMEDVRNSTQTQCASPRTVTRSMARKRRQAQSQYEHSQNNTNSCPKKARIQEVISSTKRWNLNHKDTSCSEGQFATDYFRKQSKRDPAIALLLQRALQKRLRLRQGGRTVSQPHSIEEFCKDVQWQDILETVEDVLIRGQDVALRMLK